MIDRCALGRSLFCMCAGAMQEAVKFQIHHLGDSWKDGDVIVSNHPQAGGSHLPDITVITPVFQNGERVFYVASRGHHADIGGISPGSMPPFSKTLPQEGARIVSHRLVTKDGGFDEAGIRALLLPPAASRAVAESEAPISGARNISENISDLRAQVAANRKGITLMNELIDQYSLIVVQTYMRFIQENAEVAVREMLCEISKKRGLKEVDTLHAIDYMDDGSAIRLALSIDRRDDIRFHRYERRGILEHECTTGGDVLGDHIQSASAGQTRHTTQSGMPQAHHDRDSKRMLPQSEPRCSSRRRERTHLAARHRCRTQGIRRLCSVARMYVRTLEGISTDHARRF
jgi:hypothetical protein